MTASADDAWNALADGLRDAGRKLAEATAHLDAPERTDGFRALLRALNNQLGRLETDTERPEFVPFNGWREKFFMDNPDCRYWITDIRDDRRYLITGNVGDSAFQSVTVYSGTGVADAAAVARVDTDDLTLDADGGFTLTLAPHGADLDLPAGARSLWIRHLHNDIRLDRAGWCRIDPIDEPGGPPAPDDARFTGDLARLGKFLSRLPDAFRFAVAEDAAAPNSVRHWAAMAGGAAFTEPDIHYLRGAWRLGEHEALLIEGDLVDCRHWNILLYSRFLNSLDHRNRIVSRTAASSTIVDGRYRFALAGRDPGLPGYDWLDTEGRGFGLFVMRFLQSETDPALPEVRVIPLGESR